MTDIAIFGAGGFGREVAMLIEEINLQNPTFNIIGFFDDNIEPQTTIGDYVVKGGLKEINTFNEPLGIVLAVGNPKVKAAILNKINNDSIFYPNLIHPSVTISKSQRVEIGEGCIICKGCIITVDINIGSHVIFNLNTTVGHDTIIQDYCSFMPGVNISGEVIIEEGVFFGTNSSIINQRKVENWSTIGAGATVVKNIPSNCIAVGSPAKPLSK